MTCRSLLSHAKRLRSSSVRALLASSSTSGTTSTEGPARDDAQLLAENDAWRIQRLANLGRELQVECRSP
jgi:hypothetical protein